jgi:hypothetical protein
MTFAKLRIIFYFTNFFVKKNKKRRKKNAFSIYILQRDKVLKRQQGFATGTGTKATDGLDGHG